jgi:DNA polymerase delta subunit 2
MPLKPSILKGLESILGSKKVESFVNESEDYLIIEDESGRIRVSNNSPGFSASQFITGIAIATKGRVDDKGVFILEDVIFHRVDHYSLPQRIKNSVQLNNNLIADNSVYQMLSSSSELLAFISGINFGKDDYSGKLNLARLLFIDIIQGRFPLEANIKKLINRINRLIIVGNAVYSPEETDQVEKGSYIKQELNTRVYKKLIQSYEEFDDYLDILTQSITVDLMPGASDTSSIFFPQLALSPLMLQKSGTNSSLNLANNPHKFEMNEISFIGTSGQNIDNIRKYTTISKNPIDILEKTIEWGHICPSAPDTVRTYPITGNDPLILREIPNVYFTGNQKTFETKLINYTEPPVRLISIPDFSISFSFVLIDMNTLESCEYVIQYA